MTTMPAPGTARGRRRRVSRSSAAAEDLCAGVEALQGLQELLRDVIEDMQEQGERVPLPFAERSYSGKFNLRVGESLHRELAIQAAEDGLSLNQYVLRKLRAA